MDDELCSEIDAQLTNRLLESESRRKIEVEQHNGIIGISCFLLTMLTCGLAVAHAIRACDHIFLTSTVSVACAAEAPWLVTV
jgi:hypothetical protein